VQRLYNLVVDQHLQQFVQRNFNHFNFFVVIKLLAAGFHATGSEIQFGKAGQYTGIAGYPAQVFDLRKSITGFFHQFTAHAGCKIFAGINKTTGRFE